MQFYVSSDSPAMSALGQKQTFALQKAMSALLPIAPAKADIRWGLSASACRALSSAVLRGA